MTGRKVGSSGRGLRISSMVKRKDAHAKRVATAKSMKRLKAHDARYKKSIKGVETHPCLIFDCEYLAPLNQLFCIFHGEAINKEAQAMIETGDITIEGIRKASERIQRVVSSERNSNR